MLRLYHRNDSLTATARETKSCFVGLVVEGEISPNHDSRFEPPNLGPLLSRPAATLSSIPNGGEGRGEEALRFMERKTACHSPPPSGRGPG